VSPLGSHPHRVEVIEIDEDRYHNGDRCHIPLIAASGAKGNAAPSGQI
jgi:hypothetical protein